MTLVKAKVGQIEGCTVGGVQRFLGIPYAEPITPDRRFLPPEPRAPWIGTLKALEYGPTSVQTPMPGLFSSLSPDSTTAGPDCLNLNIWTPDTRGCHPVMVWIHGGAFHAGSGSDLAYDGSRFAQNGVVCITINYRLGAQGFLDLSSFGQAYESSGCNGIADQVAALEWVRDNISAFGGDPNRVTIAGESAGAMSVATLMATPKAHGLFHQAIAQSGAAMSSVSTSTSRRVARAFLDVLDVATLEQLSHCSDEVIAQAQIALMSEIKNSQDVELFGEVAGSAMPFQPVHGCSILPKPPFVAIAEGDASDIALLQGITRDEALIFLNDARDILTPKIAWSMHQPLIEAKGLSATRFKRHYYSDQALSGFQIAGRVLSDFAFGVPVAQMLESQAQHTSQVWAYRFDWCAPESNGALGAHHFIEIPFVFDQLSASNSSHFDYSAAPQHLANQVHSSWLSFVVNGNPGHSGLPNWLPYSAQGSGMVFDEECHVGRVIDSETLSVWQSA
jgi:para-nitrobenzyl esterase